jgi:hypothetical protein
MLLSRHYQDGHNALAVGLHFGRVMAGMFTFRAALAHPTANATVSDAFGFVPKGFALRPYLLIFRRNSGVANITTQGTLVDAVVKHTGVRLHGLQSTMKTVVCLVHPLTAFRARQTQRSMVLLPGRG